MDQQTKIAAIPTKEKESFQRSFLQSLARVLYEKGRIDYEVMRGICQ